MVDVFDFFQPHFHRCKIDMKIISITSTAMPGYSQIQFVRYAKEVTWWNFGNIQEILSSFVLPTGNPADAHKHETNLPLTKTASAESDDVARNSYSEFVALRKVPIVSDSSRVLLGISLNIRWTLWIWRISSVSWKESDWGHTTILDRIGVVVTIEKYSD
jgi:hypothetical protein